MIVLIILGYALLIMLALVFCLILMLLFIPFAYSSSGSAVNASGGAYASVKWLFGAVAIQLDYKTGTPMNPEIRIGFLRFKLKMHRNEKIEGEDTSPKAKNKKKSRFTKEKLMVVFKSAKRLLTRYKPRRLIIDALVGFDDAYYTGLMCAGLSMLSPVISSPRNEVRIIPEFNDAVFEGNFETEGKVVVFFIALEGLKIFFSKPFRNKS